VTCYTIPLKPVLRDLIISADLLSRGRTLTQIQNGDLPEPIMFDGKIDAGKLTENKSMNLYAVAMVDQAFVKRLFSEEDETNNENNDEYVAGVHSTDSVVLLGIAQVLKT